MKPVLIAAFLLGCYGSYREVHGKPMTVADFYFLAGMLLVAIDICADNIVRAIRKIGGPKP